MGIMLATGKTSEDVKPTELNEAEKHINGLNNKAYNELILSCNNKISFGIVKSAKNQVYPTEDAKEAWNKLKQHYEHNTGKLKSPHKEYMSLEVNDVKDVSEVFITELEKVRVRMKEEPLNEDIPDNSFLIHTINPLLEEYKSVVDTMEKNLSVRILIVESLKEQVKSKYKCLVKSMDL